MVPPFFYPLEGDNMSDLKSLGELPPTDLLINSPLKVPVDPFRYLDVISLPSSNLLGD